MTTIAQSISLLVDTTARFRTFGATMKANFASIGLVQTLDTGQIDWTTVNLPANASTAGYEIWRMGDSLQATKPVFMKIEYGIGSPYGSGGTYGPLFAITFGTATDGAGNLTGLVSNRQLMLTYRMTTTTVPCIWAGDGTYAMFLLGYTNGGDGGNYTPGFFMLMDRTRDAIGAANGDGYWTIRTSFSGLQGYFNNLFPAGQANIINSSYNALTNTPGTSWVETYTIFDRNGYYQRGNYSVALAPGHDWGNAVDGADVTVFPLLVQAGKQTFVHAMLVGFNADFTQALPITTTVLGAVHTYLPIKFTPTGLSNHCMLLRWE